ncbi:uncharacterized protein EI90DRAFT_2031688 [Cantharellus anzutake]|uniref:uncharacterized protein n=1 Tax=Cantharellus anzutake TaxID=1750568 RepID=UPI0019086853|nr:uncharacterized protein EI90DRAFT_2031688 [Cantharellus anzutake]KAF8325890.1 hypothetical protein EI90DRAFT_2031688 [Cantharellus anzutake]
MGNKGDVCNPLAPPNTPYDYHDNGSMRVMLGIAAFIGTISATCAVCLLCFVLCRWHRLGWKRHFTPLGLVFVYWISMDAIQGVSSALSFKWAVSGDVSQDGGYCDAQGVLQQFGDAGTALSAFLVALLVVAYYFHAGWIVHHPKTVSCCLLLLFPAFLIVLIVPPSSLIHNLYGNTGLWCWIAHHSPTNARLQIGACYALMWLAALTSILGYGWVLIGTLRRAGAARQETGHFSHVPVYSVEEAWRMMWYSLAYVIEVAPISIIRFVQFGSKGPCRRVGPGWIIFAMAVYSASGLINTGLWLTTGRRFGFATEKERRRTSEFNHSEPDRNGSAPPSLDV